MAELIRRPVEIIAAFSGEATTLQKVIRETQEKGSLHGLAHVALAIATNTKKAAPGIEAVEKLDVPVAIARRGKHSMGKEGIEPYGQDVLKVVNDPKFLSVQALFLLGCNAQMSQGVLDRFRVKVNQHPGKLDPGREFDFGGEGMYRLRPTATTILYSYLTGGENPYTEATTHEPVAAYDDGPIYRFVRMPIPVLDAGSATIADFRNDRNLQDLLINTATETQKKLLPLERYNVVETIRHLAEYGGLVGLWRKDPLIPVENRQALLASKQLVFQLLP